MKKIKINEKSERQALDLMEKLWIQIEKKKFISRLITFFVIGIAVIQELFTEEGISNGWYEITLYLIMTYFGIATYRKVFNLNHIKKEEK
ncbi:hypothetical protein GF337_20545 [candidate division KSB1 bacterium]|nr:hypothetical protein [candidate division KSB1 bacterium]